MSETVVTGLQNAQAAIENYKAQGEQVAQQLQQIERTFAAQQEQFTRAREQAIASLHMIQGAIAALEALIAPIPEAEPVPAGTSSVSDDVLSIDTSRPAGRRAKSKVQE